MEDLILESELYSLIKELFPICRSISGSGVRETLRIIKNIIPIKIFDVPTGKKVFDWTIPEEWNIYGGSIKRTNGEKIIDFDDSNLHIMGYSSPIDRFISFKELKEHLHFIKEKPNSTPYVTSYYKKNWGFCLPYNKYIDMKDDNYYVKIDSEFKKGGITIGELVIKGKSKKEILISANTCHPSLANNELSGLTVAVYMAKHLIEKKDLKMTYRFVFIPETIGSIAYIYLNKNKLKKNVAAGFHLTCIGDSGDFSYLCSKNGNTLSDRAAKHTLKNTEESFKIYDYLERGSDERQFCYPGIDLPIGSLMRTKYWCFDEYHTSDDNLNFVSGKNLRESLEKIKLITKAIELNKKYITKTLCEPNLGNRGLYPTTSERKTKKDTIDLKDIMCYCDGANDLLDISDKISVPIWDVAIWAEKLEKFGLISKIK